LSRAGQDFPLVLHFDAAYRERLLSLMPPWELVFRSNSVALFPLH